MDIIAMRAAACGVTRKASKRSQGRLKKFHRHTPPATQNVSGGVLILMMSDLNDE
jgi:hypothetical protein